MFCCGNASYFATGFLWTVMMLCVCVCVLCVCCLPGVGTEKERHGRQRAETQRRKQEKGTHHFFTSWNTKVISLPIFGDTFLILLRMLYSLLSVERIKLFIQAFSVVCAQFCISLPPNHACFCFLQFICSWQTNCVVDQFAIQLLFDVMQFAFSCTLIWAWLASLMFLFFCTA